MAVSDIRLITVTCDIPVCGNTIPCGADPNHARKNGWKRVMVEAFDTPEEEEFPVGIPKDMCPTCYADLTAFLNGEDEVVKAEAINDAAEDDEPEPVAVAEDSAPISCMVCGASSSTIRVANGVCDDCVNDKKPVKK